jgi:1-acyl-sn-glycerol-3-phosphate acyltransferase
METSLIPPVGPEVHRRGNFITKALAALALLLTGWRFEGRLPNLGKFVIIVAPHTSNWDFPTGVMAMYALGLRGTFLGKDSLFKPPLGWLMRWLGGMPVDRSSTNNVVDQSVAYFAKRDRLIFVLSPEGTRKRIEKWRTGFYWVAVGAGVPIVPVAFDFPRKRFMIFPPQAMTGEVHTDMAHLRSFFKSSMAYRPANYAE